MADMQADIIALQELVAHQTQQIAELSEQVHEQYQQIIVLNKHVALLQQKLASAANEGQGIRTPDEETPPPHY